MVEKGGRLMVRKRVDGWGGGRTDGGKWEGLVMCIIALDNWCISLCLVPNPTAVKCLHHQAVLHFDFPTMSLDVGIKG